jgi:hypothetical protein
MPVMGATAVASRFSVRAKSKFLGARVAGVKPIAPRPAAAQARASARFVEQTDDDLQLGQVRSMPPPNIFAIDSDPASPLPTHPRGRPSTAGTSTRFVALTWRVRVSRGHCAVRSRRRAVASPRRSCFRVCAFRHRPTNAKNLDTANAISIGSRVGNRALAVTRLEHKPNIRASLFRSVFAHT